MGGLRLDIIDKKILRTLQDSGRISNVELAKLVGISPPPCLRRVRILSEKGYIKGYRAEIDAAKMGYGVHVFAMVTFKAQSQEDVKAFETYIAKCSIIREAHLLIGDADFILRIVAKDWDSYQEFLTKDLLSAPNVASVKSLLSVRSDKNLSGIPIE
ncbi:MAG: Lrp/AsnC family transcriptional regulator [Alphaproteobacteria bacterium]|nr:Lrp/AsnC family transcriptional regulator [Alphaproteobacteria bacterium]